MQRLLVGFRVVILAITAAAFGSGSTQKAYAQTAPAAAPSTESERAAANRLAVAARLAWNRAQKLTGAEKAAALREAREKLDTIIRDHSGTDHAVKLLSGEKIAGVSMAMLDDALAIAVKAGSADDLRENANTGNVTAMVELADRYAAGTDVEKDDAKALALYRQAAGKGHAGAMNRVGDFYDSGRGVEKNYDESLKWYRQAAEGGDAAGMFNMAYAFQHGRGVEKNLTKAIRFYRQAADNGHANAMNTIGDLYDDGRGVTQDYAESFKWYRRAAEKGHASGMFNTAYAYEIGRAHV